MAYRFYLFFTFLFISVNVCAEGFYIGAGISSIRLSSDHPSINNHSGTGYHLFAGSKYENWGIELAATGGLSFSTGQTPGIYYPEDSAEYGNLVLGFKRYFHSMVYPKLSPWIGAGLAMEFITWDTYYYNVDGFGYSISGGVDYQIDQDWFVRGCAIYHDFTSDDTYGYGPYDGTAAELNLSIIYLF